ncbi:MAG: alkaline phosphatase D family protein [Myxococcales bacterium]|nr:alkaline phosphatase D family protein [Myxococcales bacterium]MBL0196840.1 alkaline phosphatase D family protein [Myxococcales bacterium]HQY62142.1 alkaline phosphatase D family protein [Polyangiaceae bacterium]
MRTWQSLTVLAVLVAGCGSDPEAERAQGGGSPDAQQPVDASVPDTEPARDATPPSDAGADAADAGFVLVPAPQPPPPTFPATIGTLSIGLRTGTIPNAETDDPMEVCLSETRCFPLNLRDVDDFRNGGADVYQFEGVNMPRAEVDRVVLRTLSPATTDNDRFTPACLDLRFDGEPVYCNDAIGAHIGTGTSADEVASWRDPAGLKNACVTCQPSKLPGGPMLGAPGPDTVRAWVRTDATRPVGLFLSERPDGAGAVPVAWTTPRPEQDFAAVLTSPRLEANHRYFYRVSVDGETSQPFRPVRTAPSDATKVKLGFGSCSRDAAQPLFGVMKSAGLDLFLFLGDTHYGNSPYVEAHRFEYRALGAMGPRRDFLANVPALATWDDHDFVANNSDGACGGREDALRGFREAWPNPSFGTPTTPGAFTRSRFGPVEVILADCRYYRPRVNDPGRSCTLDGAPISTDFANGPLGAEQFTWLVDAIATSTATFKLVGCGSLFTSNGIDSWASFPEARDRLFADLATRKVPGVVLVSGDIHRTEVRVMPRATGYDMIELVSSPLAQFPKATNPTRSVCAGTDARRRFCYDWDSFIAVEADPTLPDPTLTATVHDEVGAAVFSYPIPSSRLR